MPNSIYHFDYALRYGQYGTFSFTRIFLRTARFITLTVSFVHPNWFCRKKYAREYEGYERATENARACRTWRFSISLEVLTRSQFFRARALNFFRSIFLSAHTRHASSLLEGWKSPFNCYPYFQTRVFLYVFHDAEISRLEGTKSRTPDVSFLNIVRLPHPLIGMFLNISFAHK